MKKVIVIGSGIVGASTAYHLAVSGVEVVVVDRGDVGQATAAAAGIVCPWISQRRNKAWYELVKHGARDYPRLVAELKELGERDTGYRQVGAISLHMDEDKLTKMAERTLKRREDAPEIGDVVVLSEAETKKLFPPVADGYGSVWVSGGARVDGRLLRDSLMSAAVKLGARVVRERNAELVVTDEGVKGVCVEGETLMADRVAVCGGAWAREILSRSGVHFRVSGQKAQIVHLQMVPSVDSEDWPVVMPPNNQYMLSFGDGHVVVGSTHEDGKEFDTRVTAGGLGDILGKALEVAPGLSEATLVETRVGFRPYTPDFLPVVGEVPGVSGLFVANGLGASGLTSGPFLGAELARLMRGERTVLDLEKYSVAGAIEAGE